MIEIKEMKSKKELLAFVKFPFSLFKNNKYWIPPIIKDELDSFNKEVNPSFEYAKAWFFTAHKNGEIVGRIAAIINTIEIEQQAVKKMRFGWMDMIDDIAVSKALLEKVYAIGKDNNLEYIEGPLGFSNLDKVGVLTEGFNELGGMGTWYSMPYYKEHLLTLGYDYGQKFIETRFPFKNIKADKFDRLSKIITEKYQLKLITFNKSKDILPYADQMFDLFNESYKDLSSFVPVSEGQKEFMKKRFIPFIRPDFITFVQDKNKKLIAFAITLPSFAKALQKANGKLFPFGFYHLLKAQRNPKILSFYLIGIDPKYQQKGINVLMFDHLHRSADKAGVVDCIQTPELETNTAIHALWKKFDPEIYKRRSTFVKNINY